MGKQLKTAFLATLPVMAGYVVLGTLRGLELDSPNGLVAKELRSHRSRTVCFTDLDRNGHMNNTKYLDWISDLLPSSFHKDNRAQEFTVCYHAEAREGDELQMGWQLREDGVLQVESWRDSPETGFHRVFAAQIHYGQEIL